MPAALGTGAGMPAFPALWAGVHEVALGTCQANGVLSVQNDGGMEECGLHPRTKLHVQVASPSGPPRGCSGADRASRVQLGARKSLPIPGGLPGWAFPAGCACQQCLLWKGVGSAGCCRPVGLTALLFSDPA